MTHADQDRQALNALALLARGLTGADIDVQPLIRVAGQADASRPARTVLAGSRVLLPADLIAGAQSRTQGRAALAHALAHWRHSPRALPAKGLQPMGIAVASAIEDARAETLLCHDFPGVRAWFADALMPRPDPGALSFAALIARMDRLLMFPAGQDDNYWVNKASERFHHTLAVTGPEDYDAFRALASILANDLGQMRVPFDPEQYVVPSAYRDDNSVLWHYDENPQAPDAAETLQTAGAPSPAAKAGGGASCGEAGAIQNHRYLYPEWNRQLARLRPDWCTVIEQGPATPSADDAGTRASGSRQAPILRLPHCSQIDHSQRIRRQWDGDEIELDRAIDTQVAQRMQLPAEPRVFMRPARRRPAASILVLLDLSASSNDRRDAGSPSLLDIEKQAALLMAESVERRRDRLAIHGFSSNTRAEVHYQRLLDFGMPLTQPARHAIDALHGRYSTRLGAALRHAAMLLDAEPNPRRAILVVTDGAPADVDVPDPRYLAEDARMAVLEARARRLQTCCIALDGATDLEVRRIFGARNVGIADTVQGLPMQLARMLGRVLAS